MTESDKRTVLYLVVGAAILYFLVKMLKPGSGFSSLGGPPANVSPSSASGYNPYLPQGTATGPSAGGSSPSDTGQWLNFGLGIFKTAAGLTDTLVQKYGGSNDSGSDSYDTGDSGFN
jgi:hypothetical protein